MDSLTAFVIATESALELIRNPAVRERWTEPSALAEMSIGDLVAHLAPQAALVSGAVREPPGDEQPVPLLEHYARSAWVDAPLDDDANIGIRQSAQEAAAVGIETLIANAEAAMAELRAVGPTNVPPTARMPWWKWSLSFDDFLVVRTMETVVHADDLAVSIGAEPPTLPDDVLEPVLSLLVMLSVRRNGQAAVVRALARRERADRPVNAF